MGIGLRVFSGIFQSWLRCYTPVLRRLLLAGSSRAMYRAGAPSGSPAGAYGPDRAGMAVFRFMEGLAEIGPTSSPDTHRASDDAMRFSGCWRRSSDRLRSGQHSAVRQGVVADPGHSVAVTPVD